MRSKLPYKTNTQKLRSLPAKLGQMEQVVLISAIKDMCDQYANTTLEELTERMNANGTSMLFHPTFIKQAWVAIHELVKEQ